MDNFILLINPYPADKVGAFLILIEQRANFISRRWMRIYPLDKVIHSSYSRAVGLQSEHGFKGTQVALCKHLHDQLFPFFMHLCSAVLYFHEEHTRRKRR